MLLVEIKVCDRHTQQRCHKHNFDRMGCFVSVEKSLPRFRVETGNITGTSSPSVPGQSSNSSASISIYSLLPFLSPYKLYFTDLSILEIDLFQFYSLYKLVKDSEEDFIHQQKFIQYFHFYDSAFATRLVTSSTKQQKEYLINIFDMILFLWHFCTIGKYLGNVLSSTTRPLIIFSALYVYDLYTTKDKPLSVIRCDEMIKEIFGRRYEKTSLAIKLNRKLQHLATNGVIHSWLFLEFTTQHPFLLSPCLSLQKRVMESTLGRSRWEKLAQCRIRRERGQYKSLDDVLERFNLNPKAKQRHNRIRSRVYSEFGLNPAIKHSPLSDTSISSSESLPSSLSSSAMPPKSKPSPIQRWYRAIGGNLNLIDTRTVIVRPLPPVDAPMSIKSCGTYSQSLDFSQKHGSPLRTAAGGLSEVKYLTNHPPVITSRGSYDNNHSLVVEDLE